MDVVRAVRYANANGIQIAMRGRGHSAYGQAQVHRGIVIDSSSLNELRWTELSELTADAGALWDEVASKTLERSLIPPVMPDMQLLTIGGTLSAGGTGEMGHRVGAQVDHVAGLEVVTGAGELVSCSASQNEELFRMTLAGMGQCALIVRAKLQLVTAPRDIAVHGLLYDDVSDLLTDCERMATTQVFDTIGSELARRGAGWRMELRLGSFTTSSDEEVAPLPAGLRFTVALPAVRMSYQTYLRRRSASVIAALANRQPNPSLILTLPSGMTPRAVRDLMSDPDASRGVWRIEILPMVAARFGQPLHRLPDGPFSFSVRLQRRASAPDAPDHLAMLRVNEQLVRTFVPAGATIYPPFAPVLSRDLWELHYGRVWHRFAAAKRRYDSNSTLTPGAGVFGAAS
jgi:FAD/FMN-containing dehydrogenase